MKKIKKHIIHIMILHLILSTPVYSQAQELFFKAAGTPVNPKVQVSWNKYYTPSGVEDFCKKLASAYPGLVTLESIGKSYQGRDIYTLTISDKSSGKPDHKPAFWIDGNIHSVELQGTEMAMYTAWYLCEMYADNVFIKQLLADKTFYITPTINPDSREYFTSTGMPPRSGLMPYDTDRDGLFDEDGHDDLNGDGNISQMRRKKTGGDYREDIKDPRRMVRVEPGETGEYEILGTEGFDNDGDGLIDEDGPGGYDGNRDWGFNWEPNYVQNGAHKYPFSQPENQAVRDFIVNHRNITGAQSFHNYGGLILKGPSIEGGGAEVYSREDEEIMNTIGKTGEKMIPGYKLITIWKDMYTVYGGELDWWHGAMGCYVWSNELWNSYLMFYDESNTDSYQFDKLLLFEDSFISWQKVNHPVYGEVEIGGFSKNVGRLHPGFLLESDAHRNAAFCIYNAYQSPKLEIQDIKVRKLSGNLNEVTATLHNSRMLPTHSATNLKYKIDPPDYIFLEGGTVIAGMIVEDVERNICVEQKKNPHRMEIQNIKGYQKINLKWIVKGGNKYTVSVESVKGGRATAVSK
ncbi:MAG TPA: M14 family metallopeptidase [Bacteroidales bacterium]|nr:M14 family metallopeptidase [Bacteroidales bacterium]